MDSNWNWQHSKWPNFEYDLSKMQEILYEYAKISAMTTGALNVINSNFSQDTIIDLMVEEASCTSIIEGQIFTDEDIRSSIRNNLALNLPKKSISDPKSEGIGELMIFLRSTYNLPLSEKMLFEWHSLLFKNYFDDNLNIGNWRKSSEAMQIVSGPIGDERIFFEAPPSSQVAKEMAIFIDWFNSYANQLIPGPIRAGIAHLYFESIHPFEDGNGRIGRMIAEKALSQDLGYPCVFSLSKAIYKTRKEYYNQLKKASGYTVNITEWLNYFVKTVYEAQLDGKKQVQFVISKALFWHKFSDLIQLRQEKVLKRMFQEGIDGFMGEITAKKYMAIANCSKATATRELSELLELGCLLKSTSSGRSTAYLLNLKK
jgi:Fic family protein